MSIFITGGTGYLGSYVISNLLENTTQALSLLIRAKNKEDAIHKLWKALQLHLSEERFRSHLSRVEMVFGDLHQPDLGLDPTSHKKLVHQTTSILHIAASLNRKSEKACLNTNLRGTLAVIKLARAIADTKGLRRFTHISTVGVSGHRSHEMVHEDEAIDWERSDYDAYGRTKKFCEYLEHELLGEDVPLLTLRPSIVMGDSRFPETTQFDMVRAFCFFADLRLLPFNPQTRLDIVNADWVGEAIVELHLKEDLKHNIYHLSAGAQSSTLKDIAHVLSRDLKRKPVFLPKLEQPFDKVVNLLAGLPQRNQITYVGSLLKVFLPYISFDTVFDNSRALDALQTAPTPFTEYGGDLYRFSKKVNFQYPYKEL
ncbi:SDR family oxidoreductase [Deltaproteobacteria bacterium TL4]